MTKSQIKRLPRWKYLTLSSQVSRTILEENPPDGAMVQPYIEILAMPSYEDAREDIHQVECLLSFTLYHYDQPRDANGDVLREKVTWHLIPDDGRWDIQRVPISIQSITMKELQDATSPTYLKHEERTHALKEPQLLRCFANTIIMRVPSSKFTENSTYWHQYIMLPDIKGLIRKNGWSVEEAVKYAIEEGDVHLYCDCPAHLYWAFKYYATRGGYTYGGYKENRAPTKNNVNAEGLIDKHTEKAFRYLQSHIDEVTTWFKEYYNVSLKKAPETPASEVTENPEKIPDKPRYTSKSSNKNDVELAYEDETTDTVYIPSEPEREEINSLNEEVKEEDQFQEDRAFLEAESDPLPDEEIVEDDTSIISDEPESEEFV